MRLTGILRWVLLLLDVLPRLPTTLKGVSPVPGIKSWLPPAEHATIPCMQATGAGAAQVPVSLAAELLQACQMELAQVNITASLPVQCYAKSIQPDTLRPVTRQCALLCRHQRCLFKSCWPQTACCQQRAPALPAWQPPVLGWLHASEAAQLRLDWRLTCARALLAIWCSCSSRYGAPALPTLTMCAGLHSRLSGQCAPAHQQHLLTVGGLPRTLAHSVSLH